MRQETEAQREERVRRFRDFERQAERRRTLAFRWMAGILTALLLALLAARLGRLL